MKRIAWRVLTLLSGIFISLLATAAVPRYEVTPFQPPGSGANIVDINDLGHTVGRYTIYYPELGFARWAHFLSLGSDYVDLGSRGAHFAPAGLNKLDQVVGTARDEASGRARAYLLTGDQVRENPSLGGHATVAMAINERGQVAGYSSLSAWDYRAFAYQDGLTVAIGSPAGPDHVSGAFDINQRGQVVGEWVDDQLHKRAFAYEVGVMTDLGTLGDCVSLAIDINNAGDIIGMVFGYAAGPFIWRDGIMANLNDYLVPGSGLAITEVDRINDLGQILGTGCHSEVCHQVLLSPIPEPGRAALLLAGLALIGLRWRGVVRRSQIQF